MMIKGVIFDMDGVLVDNSNVHIEAFVIWCRNRGIDFPPEKLRAFFGMGNGDILKVALNDPDLSPELIEIYAQEKEQIYRDIFAQSIKPMPGLVDLLEQLRARDIKIAVGSSGMRRNVDFVLEKCGIVGYFDAIADADQISKAKPDPEVFLLAASLLGLEARECLVFEDSFAGVEAARAAGMRVIALSTTFARENHRDYDLILRDFTELPSLDIIL